MERYRGSYFERKPEVHPERKPELIPDVTKKASTAHISNSFEDTKALLPQFKEAYMQRPLVIGAGLGVEETPKGLRRAVFKVYLKGEPTPDDWKFLKKTFKRAPIRYNVTGPVVAVRISS